MSRIKVIFKAQKGPQTTNILHKEINGFVNRVFGPNNKYHGKFSNYSVSTMQSDERIYDCNGIRQFPDGGYIYFSTPDEDVMSDFKRGLWQDGLHIGSMDIDDGPFRLTECDYSLNKNYDLVRFASSVYVTDNKRNTLRFNSEPEQFVSTLREKSVKKLKYNGIDELAAESIQIELFHPENGKIDVVKCGKQTNITNKVMLRVSGDINARRTLYELGMGKSTGFCFGAVTINDYSVF